MATPTNHVLAHVHRAATICTVSVATIHEAVTQTHAAIITVAPIMAVAISAFATNPTKPNGQPGHAPTTVVPTEIHIRTGTAQVTAAAVEADGSLQLRMSEKF